MRSFTILSLSILIIGFALKILHYPYGNATLITGVILLVAVIFLTLFQKPKSIDFRRIATVLVFVFVLTRALKMLGVTVHPNIFLLGTISILLILPYM